MFYGDTIVDFDSVNFHYYENRGKTKEKALLFSKQFENGNYFSYDLISSQQRRFTMKTMYVENAEYKKRSSSELPSPRLSLRFH